MVRNQVTTSRVNVDEADQFQRFLFLFQHVMTSVIDRVDGNARPNRSIAC